MTRRRFNWPGLLANVCSGAAAGATAATVAAGYHLGPVLIGAGIGILAGVGGFFTPRHRSGGANGS